MGRSIIIIGSGVGGLSTGIHGQCNGFTTTIFEAHTQPGGQCTNWKRKGYVFDPCLHSLNGFKANTRINHFWEELGAMPCDTFTRNEFVSALSQDGTYFHNYLDPDRLESHLKKLSPDDADVIDDYIGAIKSFQVEVDWFGISNFGTLFEKLSTIPFLVPKLRYFRYTLGSFGKRFKHPLLKKAIPLVRNSLPDIPLFAYLAEHTSAANGDILWPKGGSSTITRNMASHYMESGGTIELQKKVVKILTSNDRACGVELHDGTRHTADFVVSNADGRKTILELLGGHYINKKVLKHCEPYPEDADLAMSVLVFLGVNMDLSSYPSSLILFLDKLETIAGHECDHLHLQIYGFDSSMAPAGKGVIKIELFARPSHFSRLREDGIAYRAEKDRIAEHVVSLLEKKLPLRREDLEVVDVCTLNTWERYMGGSQGFNNFPKKYDDLTDIRNVLDFLFGLNRMFSLPGLKNFYFVGQWVTSMGSLFSNALTGKAVIEKICKTCGVRFGINLPNKG